VRRWKQLGVIAVAISALGVIPGARPAGAVHKTNVVIQGGTTPVDSGLYQNVLLPMFSAKYPQFNLQYVAVGTGQAITNAEAGQGDVVFTHSPTLEDSFVTNHYSYEAGGRLVMASDFVTVGAKSDPAGVVTAGNHDAVHGFLAIAQAGANGHADFVSRGDTSGTNKNEESIWKLTGIPVDSLGEPTTDPSDPSHPHFPSWYHTTGDGQAANLQVTDQCPFSSGACYTLTDSGTFNYLNGTGAVTDLKIVSRYNDGPNALGGVSLLLNPYHVYAVNPARIPNAHINLAGALAFLNFMTDRATQNAIGNYPNAANPAFYPDARPIVQITQGLPAGALASQTLTVTGTVQPAYYLDPPIAGAPVFLERTAAPGVVVASATLDSNDAFSISFHPSQSGTYKIFVPQYPDGIVLPSNTGYRQTTSKTLTKLVVKPVVTIALGSKNGLSVDVNGTALPSTNRQAATVQVQYKAGTSWSNIGSPVSMGSGTSAYDTTVTVPSAGTYKLRALYTDPGNVAAGFSPTVSVSLP
jgi:tungstate transport system substrate-binding protein